jgi:subfamily B ATP-binding cassette protein MsbA
MFQNAGQLDVYRDKLIPWVPALRELSHEQFLFYAILAAASLFLFKNLFLVLAGYWNLRVVSSLYYFWVSRISQIYLNKPYKFFLQNETGDLVQRKIVQTQRASEALRVLIMLLGSGTAILGVLLVLCYMNAKVTLMLIFLLIPVYYISMRFSRSGVYRAGKRLVQLEKQGFDIASETILGIKPIKFSGSKDFFYQRAKKIWKEYSLHNLHARFMPILPRPVLETLAVLGGLGVAYVYRDAENHIGSAFPMLAVLLAGVYRIIPLASAGSAQVISLTSLLPSVEVVVDILQEKPAEKKDLVLPSMVREIKFQNVSFAYRKRDFVLRELTLKFEANKFYGIVGASGCGKSTVVDLMSGLHKPQEGRVLVDGTDINDADIDSWFHQLGIVSQEAFIFSGTIEDNICLGVAEGNRDQNRMIESAKASQIHDYIEQLPMGYQAVIGERGLDLSGGQRQRLAIARAIYLDPPILIFDEATSSLDAVTMQKVKNIFESMRGRKTIIVVAHSLVTVFGADHIYVLEDGGLVEEGTHEELSMGGGLYNRLCVGQNLE